MSAARARVLVFLSALGVKAAVWLGLRDHPLLQPAGDLDGAVYLDLARHGAPPVAYFLSPLYFYFLKLTHGSLLLQIVLGSAAVVLLFDTASRWFGERAAWITALLAIGTGVVTFNEVTILQSALDPFLVALMAWCLTRALQRDDGRGFIAAGAAAALFALNRPNVLLWIAALGTLLLMQRRWRATLAFAAGCALVLTPVAARNVIVAHELVLVSSHGGLNFYIGNNETADGRYHAVPGIRPTIAGQSEDTRLVAERATGRSMTSREVSRWFYARSFAWIGAHPADALRLLVRKLAFTINETDLALNYSYDYFRRDVVSALRFLVIGPWLLVPLGIAGAMTRIRDRGFLMWFAFVPVYAISVAVFFVSSRYRLPLLVVLAICAAGVVHVRRVTQLIPALLLGAIAIFPFGLDSGRGNEQTSMVVWLIEQHHFAEAETMMKKIEPAHDDVARLHHRAAIAYAEAGDTNRAVAMYEQVLHDPIAQPVLRENAIEELVRAYARAGRNEDAHRLLAAIDERSLSPSRAATFGRLALEARDSVDAIRFLTRSDSPYDLGVALLAHGDNAAAIEALRRAPHDAPSQLMLAIAYAQSGNVTEARRSAEEALRLRPGFVEAKRFYAGLPQK
jgi:Flp pilus assembly protein TadD